MARFNITLPDALDEQLQTEAAQRNIPKSTLIAQHIEKHYATNEGLERLGALEQEYKVMQEQLTQERNQATQIAEEQAATVTELRNKLASAATRTKSLEQEAVEKDKEIQQLEQNLTATRDTIQELQQGSQELIKQVEQERTSKETVKTGLQHELERSQDGIKRLEEHVVELKGQIQDLKDDKQSLQKQLELVTLRLPAPKEGFWARTFGRRKKEVKR